MAAGLSLAEENVEAFRKALNDNARLTEEDFIPKIWIDVPMPIGYVTESLVEQMELLEPFGKGNPRPLFAQKNIQVSRFSVFGKNKNVAKMLLTDETGSCQEGIYFGDMEKMTEVLSQKAAVSILYYPRINEYQGRRSLQIVIQSVQ